MANAECLKGTSGEDHDRIFGLRGRTICRSGELMRDERRGGDRRVLELPLDVHHLDDDDDGDEIAVICVRKV